MYERNKDYSEEDNYDNDFLNECFDGLNMMGMMMYLMNGVIIIPSSFPYDYPIFTKDFWFR